jgi:hypothetical protein
MTKQPVVDLQRHTLHHAGHAPRHLLRRSADREDNRSAGYEFLPSVRRAIVEEHGQPDLLGLLQQISAVPTA